jgi:glycosyltransferase involved in cell wall biosynthesis
MRFNRNTSENKFDILYITQNGITEFIGRSQVAPYILELARMGYKIHLLSAEKSSGNHLILDYEQQFDEAGIKWTKVRYRYKPPIIGQILTHIIMMVKAFYIVRSESISVIHCRSFPPTIIAYFLKKIFDIKYIFDFRDFHADGGMSRSKGLKWFFYRLQKYLEGPMIIGSSKVVCLTERAVKILGGWYFKDDKNYQKNFQVIPCCADFNLFKRSNSNDLKLFRAKLNLKENIFVLLYLGSLGSVYMLPEMLLFFRQVCRFDPTAHFLFVSNSDFDLIEKECKLQNISMGKIRYVKADRNEISHYISLADLSVFFISPSGSKEGCSPTKLAEIFACNIPVITNFGIGDLDSIININSNGSMVIGDFFDGTMYEAIESVMNVKNLGEINIRENSKQFSLDIGVNSYAKVYKELLNKSNGDLKC